MDPVYGYQAVNVEAQERSPSSLLNWMQRMLALRRQHQTFGRGTIQFLQPANRKILSFVRQDDGETILVVANLARTVQPVELDLREFKGLTPVEMLGRTEFPRIGEPPYFLTLGPYGFYWFLLVEQPAPVSARLAAPEAHEETSPLPALLAGGAWDTLLDGNVRRLIERECLPRYLPRQRWFAGRARQLTLRAASSTGRSSAGAATRSSSPSSRSSTPMAAASTYFLPLVADSRPTAEQPAQSAPRPRSRA